MRRARLISVSAPLWLAALAVLAPSASALPHAQQMVVFRGGRARIARPLMTQTTVMVKRRRCAVAAATPLAVLVHSRVGPLGLRDFGRCSKRPADGGSLFVTRIGPDRNRGSDGWVFKVGNVLGTAGAADPSGPFGRGRLRAGARVTWFWCHVSARNGGCPHTLGISASVSGRTVVVRVRHFNDYGRARVARGAIVHVGSHTAATGRRGVARIKVGKGGYRVWATQGGRIRSFPIGVRVR